MASADGEEASDAEEAFRQQGEIVRQAVESLLREQRAQQALAEALREPPYGAQAQEVRDSRALVVLKVMGAFKEADIKGVVVALGEEELSTLLKYLYRFWEMGQTSKQLFTWHAALVEQGGEGAIMRAIYDWRWP